MPADSFVSVYAKDGTSQSLITSPFSISYTLSDRQVLQLSMSYEYTVFDTGQFLGGAHPGGFPAGNSDVACFETPVPRHSNSATHVSASSQRDSLIVRGRPSHQRATI